MGAIQGAVNQTISAGIGASNQKDLIARQQEALATQQKNFAARMAQRENVLKQRETLTTFKGTYLNVMGKLPSSHILKVTEPKAMDKFNTMYKDYKKGADK